MHLLLILTFAVIILAAIVIYLVNRNSKLHAESDDLKDLIDGKDIQITRLNSKLIESFDDVESLQVVIDDQKKIIKHHEQIIEECSKIVETKSESTQYPVAPPDLTVKKKLVRDSKGHFIKQK